MLYHFRLYWYSTQYAYVRYTVVQKYIQVMGRLIGMRTAFGNCTFGIVRISQLSEWFGMLRILVSFSLPFRAVVARQNNVARINCLIAELKAINNEQILFTIP